MRTGRGRRLLQRASVSWLHPLSGERKMTSCVEGRACGTGVRRRSLGECVNNGADSSPRRLAAVALLLSERLHVGRQRLRLLGGDALLLEGGHERRLLALPALEYGLDQR